MYDDAVKVLGGAHLFRGTDPEAVRRLAVASEVVELEPGATLTRQGEPADCVYVVAEGRLEASVQRMGESPVVVGTLGPGDAIGEVQLVAGGTRLATVVATTPVRALRLAHAAFDQAITVDPALLGRLGHTVITRLLGSQLTQVMTGVLGELDREAVAELARSAEWVFLRSDEALFHQGDPGDAWYIVASGRLQVVAGGDADATVRLGEVGRGESIGEMALLTGEARSASVYAVRDSYVVRITRAAFERILVVHPSLMLSIAKTLVGRIRMLNARQVAPHTYTVISVVPATPDAGGAEFCEALTLALSRLGRTVRVNADTAQSTGIVSNPRELSDDHPQWLRFSVWMEESYVQHDYIVLEADAEANAWSRRAVRLADQVIVLADASGDPKPGRAERNLLGLRRGVGSRRVRRSLVLQHPPGTALPKESRPWRDDRNIEEHHHVRRGVAADVERVARGLTGKQIGLVLGGGGARGFAHIGVVRALRERGVPIDAVGGTSMGALIGGQVAMGRSPAEITEVMRRMVAAQPFRDYTVPVFALLRTKRIVACAHEAFGDVRIEDLWLNYFAIAANISTAEMVVMDRGPLWHATRASGSLPGILLPVIHRGSLLIDGGILNNLPGDVMRERWGGRVITVNVSPKEDLSVAVEAFPSPVAALGRRALRARPAVPDPPNIAGIIMRTTTLGSAGLAERVAREADLALEPPIQPFGLLDFERIDQIIDVGYRDTVRALDELGPAALAERFFASSA